MDHPETTLPPIRTESSSKGTCQRSGPETSLPMILDGLQLAGWLFIGSETALPMIDHPETWLPPILDGRSIIRRPSCRRSERSPARKARASDSAGDLVAGDGSSRDQLANDPRRSAACRVVVHRAENHGTNDQGRRAWRQRSSARPACQRSGPETWLPPILDGRSSGDHLAADPNGAQLERHVPTIRPETWLPPILDGRSIIRRPPCRRSERRAARKARTNDQGRRRG